MSYLRGEALVGGYGSTMILNGCSVEAAQGEVAVIVEWKPSSTAR